MNAVDPCPAHVGKDFNVYITRQKLCLETSHLAGGCSLSFHCFTANNPPHGRITSEALGIIHIFITANTTKYRLAELTRHTVPTVLACSIVLEKNPGNLG